MPTAYRWMDLAKQAAPALLGKLQILDEADPTERIIEVAADVDLQPQLYEVIERETKGRTQADFLAALFAESGEEPADDEPLPEINLKGYTAGERHYIKTLRAMAEGKMDGLTDHDGKTPLEIDEPEVVQHAAAKFLRKIAGGMDPGRAWAGILGKLHSGTRAKTDHAKNWSKHCTGLKHSAPYIAKMSITNRAEATRQIAEVLAMLPAEMVRELVR